MTVGSNKTPFGTRVEILADFWNNCREDEEVGELHEDDREFIEFHNLGLPLAFMLANDFLDMEAVTESPASNLIDETFDLLLMHWNQPKDIGFQNLDEITGAKVDLDFGKKIAEAALNLKKNQP